jgi:uncharacterized protein
MTSDTCICVFVKPPEPGKVKTRLIPMFGAEGAAALAEAFFRDTWDCLESLDWALSIVASTETLNTKLADSSAEVWLQGEGDLGERIERVLTKGLARKPFAIALGADSPGIPKRLLEDAHQALRSADAVLGPCEDGGFYLLGLSRSRPGLLADIPWSQPTTFSCTLDRLRAQGLETAILEPWFDVDRPEDLVQVSEQLVAGGITAPNTARVIARLDLEMKKRWRSSNFCSRVAKEVLQPGPVAE